MRPSNPIPGHRSRGTTILKDTCAAMFMAALCMRAKTWMKPKWVRTGVCVNKMGYTHTAISLSHKEGDIMPCPATRNEVEMIIHSDVSKTKEDKYVISLGGGF